jgi:hypothetical protein
MCNFMYNIFAAHSMCGIAGLRCWGRSIDAQGWGQIGLFMSAFVIGYFAFSRVEVGTGIDAGRGLADECAR